AQEDAVKSYLRGVDPIAIFREIDSGKNAARPELAKAISLCEKEKATLVIAKLDRLARSVHLISGLMKSGVEFVACDMPEANRLTIHIIAAVAEDELERISSRTKAALAALKKKGVKLGNPRWQETIPK